MDIDDNDLRELADCRNNACHYSFDFFFEFFCLSFEHRAKHTEVVVAFGICAKSFYEANTI